MVRQSVSTLWAAAVVSRTLSVAKTLLDRVQVRTVGWQVELSDRGGRPPSCGLQERRQRQGVGPLPRDRGERILPSIPTLLDQPFWLDPSDRHHMAAVMQAESRPLAHDYIAASGDLGTTTGTSQRTPRLI
jgi:hypothetical protein